MGDKNNTEYTECDLTELTNRIFKEEPKAPKSYMISFDNICMKEVFEALLTFLVNGMKILYGNSNGVVEIQHFNINTFEILRQYILSIGFDLVVNPYNNEDWKTNIFPHFVQFNNLPYDETQKYIGLYQFAILKPEIDLNFIISFRELKF